jgi:hypothetical protein
MTVAAPARRRPDWHHLLVAAICYIPLLATRPGRVAADTKQFFYLDPFWMLGRVSQMWDESTGLGTVTHQNIGYLFPMGPWFALLRAIHAPTWIAQRLWFATILFLAAAGVMWLLHLFGIRRGPATVAALLYALSPYGFVYLGRTSVLLLPVAGLPWLVGLTVRSLREGGWRLPAAFALVVTLIGATNASSLVFIALGPLLWIPYAVWVLHDVGARRAGATIGRIGALTLPTQLWWLVGLRVQARYGLPILQLTETVQTVADTSTASEVGRYLGYWYFYGRDGVGPWTNASSDYTQRLWLIVLSYALPVLGIAGALLVRWRARAYFIVLVVAGTLIAVGTHPYLHPPLLGAVFKAAAGASSAGLALRNSPRAVPLLMLGIVACTAALLQALADRVRATTWIVHRPRAIPAAFAAVGVLAVLNAPPLWMGRAVQPQLQRQSALPAYWTAVTNALDQAGTATRVLEMPGMDFGTYRWGTTQDILTPGLMNRPWVGRELIPLGSPASVDLLRAFDRRLQEGSFDPASVAPIARLFGASTVLARFDTAYERDRTPRPRALWEQLLNPPAGLTGEQAYGEPVANRAVASQPMIDEIELGLPANAPYPPPVVTYDVTDPLPIVRTRPTERPLVLAGSGDGLVDAAEANLLTPDQLVEYSASLDPTELADALAAGADVLVTDTNARQGQRWGLLRENLGYIEAAGETKIAPDPKDARLDLFPGTGDEARTVAEQRGVASVRATHYGNPVSYTPEDRAANALDGDVRTAWQVGAFDEVRGEALRVDLQAPVTTDHVNVVQPQRLANRWITKATLTFDGGNPVHVDLTDASRTPDGQDLTFPTRTFTRLDITIDDVNIPHFPFPAGLSPVGFAEVRIPTVTMQEYLRLPADVLSNASAVDPSHRVMILVTRGRANAAEPYRAYPEARLARTLTLAAPRTFTLTGQARLSPDASDLLLESALGIAGAASGGVTANSSDRLPGLRSAYSLSAIDGDPATFWSPGYGPQVGRFVEYTMPSAVRLSHLDLTVIADGRHSVPTELQISADGAAPVTVPVPSVADGTDENHTATVPLDFAAIEGRTIRVTVSAVRSEKTVDYYNPVTPIEMPVAITELGASGVRAPALPATLPSTCRADLFTLDGAAVPVRVIGTTAAALAGDPLEIVACDGTALNTRLDAGRHDLRSADGRDTGVDLDRVLLASDRGDVAAAIDPGTGAPPPPLLPAAPTVEVTKKGLSSFTLRVNNANAPFWLVLGESRNDGWKASVGATNLGTPRLVDGYANGWLITPPATTFTVHLDWTPQRLVWIGIAASSAAAVGCVFILGRARTGVATIDDGPVLDGRRASGSVRWRTTLTAAVLAAIGAFAAAGAAIALLVAVVTVVGLRWRHGRWVSGGVAIGTPLLVGLYTAARQFHSDYPPGIEWPTAMAGAHVVSLAALMVLATDAVVRWLRHRGSRHQLAVTGRPSS